MRSGDQTWFSFRRLAVSIAFGLAGFALNFADLQLFDSPSFKVNILPGLFFPMLVAQAWGWRYGLVSALAGGAQSMWWLWGGDGWGVLYSVPVFTAWIVWHGYWADRRRVQPRRTWLTSRFTVEIPFRVFCEIGFYTVFRWLVSLNPPPWNTAAVWSDVSLAWVNMVAVKHLITGYILLLAVHACLGLGPVRRFFGLARGPAQRETTAIYAGAVLTGLLLWFLDALVEALALHTDKSFWQAAVLEVGPHELFMRGLYVVFALAAAAFIAKYNRHRVELRERLDHQNHVLSAIRNVNQLITHEKNPRKLLARACSLMVETRGFHNAWIVLLDGDLPREPFFHAGFNGGFEPMADSLRRGRLPQCARKALTEADVQVVQNPAIQCTDCPLSGGYAGRAGLTRRLEHGGELFGLLSVSVPKAFAADKEEQDLLQEVAKDISFALWSLESEARRRSTQREYAAVLESTADAILASDMRETIVLCNPAAEKLLALSQAQALGEPISRFIPPERREEHRELVKKAFAGDGVQGVETALLDAQGREVPVEMTLNPRRGEDERPIGLSAVIRDTTERRKAQEALRLHQHITTTLPHPMAFVDREYRYRAVNEIYAKIYGAKPANIIGQGVFDFCGQEVFERDIRPNLDRCLSGEDILYEVHVDFPGVGLRWMEMHYRPYKEPDGAVSGVVAHGTDITERKLAEESLQESQERFERMLTMIPDMISIHDPDMRIVYSNWSGFGNVPAGRRRVGEKCHLVYRESPDVCPDCRAIQVLESRQPFQDEVEVGEGLWVDLRIIPLLDENGEVELFVEWVRDISDSKRAEAALRESEQRFRSVIEDLPAGVFAHDLDGRIVMVNEAARRNTGYSTQELLSMTVADIDPANVTRQDREELWINLHGRGRTMVQSSHVRKDGSSYPAEVHINAITLDGQPSILGMAVDITDRKQAEEERARLLSSLAAKNSELEQVLYVASHDLRSPLVNIEGYGRELERSLQDLRKAVADVQSGNQPLDLEVLMDEDIPESLRFIRTSASKMDTLLTGLLRLSRTGRAALNIEPLDMNQLMKRVVDATEYQIRENGVDVVLGDLPRCKGDAVQVNQVFSNLLSNALKYLDTDRPGAIRISGAANGARVVYSVRDNGVGMNPGHLSKIFEIFHRLDPSRGEGEGLGLTIVKRILDRLNGDVRVESEIGRGSTFHVALPAVESDNA